MPTAGLLAVVDDIATLLDDVAVLTKAAAQKTAGVLADDLALNAEQVTGVRASRELPVVWAVAKGSLLNKALLVPAALTVSSLAPWAVTPALMLGGAFLCFEGVEKLAHRWLHPPEEERDEHRRRLQAFADPETDLVAFEKQKIKGAVRTDFILSAEIIVIVLGTVTDEPLATRLLVLVAMSVLMTVGVYGLVGGIVKLDDVGLYLTRGADTGARHAAGRLLLRAAPLLMRFLSIAGTVAMFLVGGGILTHGVKPVHQWTQQTAATLAHLPGGEFTGGLLLEALVGVLAGAVLVFAVTAGKRMFARPGFAG